jgi:hypothetical protein
MMEMMFSLMLFWEKGERVLAPEPGMGPVLR